MANHQKMEIESTIVDRSIQEIFGNIPYIESGNSNFRQCHFPAANFCSVSDVSTNYSFMNFDVHNLGVYVNARGELKKVVFSVIVLDPHDFYHKVIDYYGMPETSSLSKYYIEQQGYTIPPKIEKDSLEMYYKKLRLPTVEDYPILRNITWYEVKKDSFGNSTDMIISNKGNPENLFSEKEIWIMFRKSKVYDEKK